MNNTAEDYQTFLASKALTVASHGFEPSEYITPLFPFQRDIVRLACKLGRFCVWADCGLGKTIIFLEWAHQVCQETGQRVLILAPLAVSHQIVREAEKFGVPDVAYAAREGSTAARIVVTNYQKLQHFNPDNFIGIVCDECFAPDTLIDVIDLSGQSKQKRIRDIQVGETICNASGLDIVSDIHRREVTYAVKVSVGGRNITCSPNHPWFTRRGWIGAQDLIPLDEILATSEAMRMVQQSIHPTTASNHEEQILRQILLSELADDTDRNLSKGAQSGSSQETRDLAISMAEFGSSGCISGNRADTHAESFTTARSAGQDLPHVESDGPRTFRAWGKWSAADRAAAIDDGCSWRELEIGISYLTGPTDSRISDELQSRYRRARSENCYRSGWILTRQQEETRREEGCQTAFTRVDSIEILEQGHPELDQWRDAEGRIYFYDIGGTRHPSFSVNGCLVHNSSILKSMDGKTRTAIIEAFAKTPYRLASSATPAPNDHMELGNHAEFLGIMSRVEMLSMFFVHDGGDTSKWRLKGHAQEKFWEWVCTWAVTLRKPSDLGYEDGGFLLPPLNMHHHTVESTEVPEGMLFATEAQTLTDRRNVRRASMSERIAKTIDVARTDSEQWLIWCDLNAEQDALKRVFGEECVSIRGATPDDDRVPLLDLWLTGKRRVLVSKPSVFGYGLNLQVCHNIAFVGLSDSWEQYYQAIRRCWRFGQTHSVECHIIASSAEGAVTANILRKEKESTARIEAMVEIMKLKSMEQLKQVQREVAQYSTASAEGHGWLAYMGDCVESITKLDSDSVHYSIFSPPFASLYTYSNSDRDMGNCKDHEDFGVHFQYLVKELFRVIMPGRLVSFHCMNLPKSKTRDGVIGVRDFRGELIQSFEEEGFVYHSEVCIWKDPVTAMQRTKAIGLLHKQVVKDSAMSRQGIPDYLVTMRKPGVNPEPVAGKLDSFAGEDAPKMGVDPVRNSINIWQRYASPVWMDINPSDTLQFRSARENDDERHICPLQLDVIRRGMQLWTNEGDIVVDPFMGIASTGFVAIEMNRQFIGFELKPSYYEASVKNLRRAESDAKHSHAGLFDEIEERAPIPVVASQGPTATVHEFLSRSSNDVDKQLAAFRIELDKLLNDTRALNDQERRARLKRIAELDIQITAKCIYSPVELNKLLPDYSDAALDGEDILAEEAQMKQKFDTAVTTDLSDTEEM